MRGGKGEKKRDTIVLAAGEGVPLPPPPRVRTWRRKSCASSREGARMGGCKEPACHALKSPATLSARAVERQRASVTPTSRRSFAHAASMAASESTPLASLSAADAGAAAAAAAEDDDVRSAAEEAAVAHASGGEGGACGRPPMPGGAPLDTCTEGTGATGAAPAGGAFDGQGMPLPGLARRASYTALCEKTSASCRTGTVCARRARSAAAAACTSTLPPRAGPVEARSARDLTAARWTPAATTAGAPFCMSVSKSCERGWGCERSSLTTRVVARSRTVSASKTTLGLILERRLRRAFTTSSAERLRRERGGNGGARGSDTRVRLACAHLDGSAEHRSTMCMMSVQSASSNDADVARSTRSSIMYKNAGLERREGKEVMQSVSACASIKCPLTSCHRPWARGGERPWHAAPPAVRGHWHRRPQDPQGVTWQSLRLQSHLPLQARVQLQAQLR